MNRLFSRWLPGATLLTWSGVLLLFFFSGRVNALLTPTFRPHVLWAGIGLALMAAAYLLTPASIACCADETCGHTFSRKPLAKILTFLVLLLPITLCAVVSPDGFSIKAMENRGIDTDGSTLRGRKPPAALAAAQTPPAAAPTPSPAQPTAPAAAAPNTTNPSAAPSDLPAGQDAATPDYLQRTADGTIIAEVLDLLYAAQDSALRKDFEDKRIELVGQLMPEKTGPDSAQKRFKAVRMFMTCCAADARPVATLVEADELPNLPEMTWIKIVGTSTFPIVNGRRTAIIKAEKVSKTEPPTETLLY